MSDSRSDGTARWQLRVGILAIIVAVAIGAWQKGVFDGSTPNTTSESTPLVTHRHSTKPAQTPPPGGSLSAKQLEPILVPETEYKSVLGEEFNMTGEDGDRRALKGGLASLKICSSAVPASGLGAEVASAFGASPQVGTLVYVGSDAASFGSRQEADGLLSAAAEQAPTCGWRTVAGPVLDDQTVRLTTDGHENGEGVLYIDMILVRDQAAVAAVATETTKGSHSADAERLADGLAARLARAVRHA